MTPAVYVGAAVVALGSLAAFAIPPRRKVAEPQRAEQQELVLEAA